MDLNDFEKQILECDNVHECETFIERHFDDIKLLFSDQLEKNPSFIKYNYSDLFDELRYSNIGNEISIIRTLPKFILSLLSLFASFFHRTQIRASLNDIAQLLPSRNSMKCKLLAIYEYNNITNISEDYYLKFTKINDLVHTEPWDDQRHGKNSFVNILSEYYLTGMVSLFSLQKKDAAYRFKSLFQDNRDYELLGTDTFLKYLNSNVNCLDKQLLEINQIVSLDFFNEGCRLGPNSDDPGTGTAINLPTPGSQIGRMPEKEFQFDPELPYYLEELLFKKFNAQYQRTQSEVQTGVDADEDYLKIYLGTYFPRSFVELYNIMQNLLNQDAICKIFESKKRINILDVGSGTGGSVIGVLESLLGKKDVTKRIDIFSIDGNDISLGYQKDIISCLNKKHNVKIKLHAIHKLFPNLNSQFKIDFEQLLKGINNTYDIIITSKFICEFYNTDYHNAKGMYYSFAEITSEHLSPEGLMILSDITTNDNGFEWIPVIINKEISEFIDKSNTYDYILPLSCAQWNSICRHKENCYTQIKFKISHIKNKNDLSKITYKVITNKTILQQILDSVSLKTMYKINSVKPNLVCSFGCHENSKQTDVPEAFFF